MSNRPSREILYDAAVVGGGFYGCCLAAFLKGHLPRVILLEKEGDLLGRASFVNQARVHGGYHYPRSFMTAWRSWINLPRFYLDFRECIEERIIKVYALARNLSQVNAFQFRKFCERIGATLKPAPPSLRRLFNPDLIEEVFLAKEYVFNALQLRRILKERLERSGVEVLYHAPVAKVSPMEEETGLELILSEGGSISSRLVFNCTYSQINALLQRSGLPPLPMKHELTELALIEVPPELKELGITVMDGPFFSVLPFPPKQLHSLSHVRYTPHEAWRGLEGVEQAERRLKEGPLSSNFPMMWKDAQRYLPCLARARYQGSLFEIKTVLQDNEVDDGRPILFRTHPQLPGLITIMGGKIDNIYDVLKALERMEHFSRKSKSFFAQDKIA